MRTTLDIDDDLLATAKELARREGATTGQVISRLLRHALTDAGPVVRSSARQRTGVARFRPFSAKPGVVTTNEQVNALRDSEAV